MTNFIRWNGVVRFKCEIRAILVPIHILFLVMLLLGLFDRDFGAFCDKSIYPRIFVYQYCVFFFTYLVFLILHRCEYFVEWDPKALSPVLLSRHAD